MHIKSIFIFLSLFCSCIPLCAYEGDSSSNYLDSDRRSYRYSEGDVEDSAPPRKSNYDRPERDKRYYDMLRRNRDLDDERERISRELDAERERKIKELEEESQRRCRDLEEERQRKARDLDEAIQRKCRDLEEERQRICRDLEEERQRKCRDLEDQRALKWRKQERLICQLNNDEYNSDYYDNCFSTWKNLLTTWNLPSYIYLEQTVGRWVGHQRSYTSMGAFTMLPKFVCSNITPFIDIRGHYFTHGSKAGNFGMGLRYEIPNTTAILGLNVFYDYRNTSWHNYNQFGIGLEALSPCWDVRLNGYFPMGQKMGFSRLHVFDNYIGDYCATCQQRRKSMWGLDLQFGRWFIRKGPCQCYDLYGSIKPYYYNSKKHTIAGAQISFISHIGRYLYAELRAGYDHVTKAVCQGRVGVDIPLYGYSKSNKYCTPCCVNDVLIQPVQREEIIALDKKDCCWTWNWDSPACRCGHRDSCNTHPPSCGPCSCSNQNSCDDTHPSSCDPCACSCSCQKTPLSRKRSS